MSKKGHYKSKYGAWAGNSRGQPPDYNFCCAEITYYIGQWPHQKQCGKKCGYGPDGAYCKVHDPKAVEERREKSDARYREKTNKERYQWYGKTFYDALEQIANGHNDAMGLAKAVIKKFQEGMN